MALSMALKHNSVLTDLTLDLGDAEGGDELERTLIAAINEKCQRNRDEALKALVDSTDT